MGLASRENSEMALNTDDCPNLILFLFSANTSNCHGSPDFLDFDRSPHSVSATYLVFEGNDLLDDGSLVKFQV